MERNDWWLYVKSNCIVFIGKKLLNLDYNNKALKIDWHSKSCNYIECCLFFEASQTMGYTGKSR